MTLLGQTDAPSNVGDLSWGSLASPTAYHHPLAYKTTRAGNYWWDLTTVPNSECQNRMGHVWVSHDTNQDMRELGLDSLFWVCNICQYTQQLGVVTGPTRHDCGTHQYSWILGWEQTGLVQDAAHIGAPKNWVWDGLGYNIHQHTERPRLRDKLYWIKT